MVKAQSEGTAEDARVQKPYGQAKAAEARGDLTSAAASYESLLQIAPRLAPAYNNLGSLHLRQREYKKAAAVLEKGLKLDPKMSSASALLGMALYEMGDYAAAGRNLESALRANPKDNNAELFLANDLIKLGEFERAAEHLRQLSQRQPENQEGVDRARALIKLERHAEAVKDLEAAIKAAPAEAQTHFLLGQTYRALGPTQDAQAEMKVFSKLEESARAKTAERAKELLQEKSKEPQVPKLCPANPK